MEKQPKVMDKLKLTFRDNQWTDQHGRRVVNVNDEKIEVVLTPLLWGKIHHNRNIEWPGTFHINWIPSENVYHEEVIRLIPPVASEPQATQQEELETQLKIANNSYNVRSNAILQLTKENAELKNAYNRLEKQSREYGQYGVKKDEECTTLRSRVAELEGIIRDWLKAIPNRSINFPYYEVMLKSEAALKSGD